LERSDNPGIRALYGINKAESDCKIANNIRVENASRYLTPGCRCAPTLMKLANAFGVDENLLKKTRTRELATQRVHREEFQIRY
jgi:hypothetical protein